jgi:hypothetical protein
MELNDLIELYKFIGFENTQSNGCKWLCKIKFMIDIFDEILRSQEKNSDRKPLSRPSSWINVSRSTPVLINFTQSSLVSCEECHQNVHDWNVNDKDYNVFEDRVEKMKKKQEFLNDTTPVLLKQNIEPTPSENIHNRFARNDEIVRKYRNRLGNGRPCRYRGDQSDTIFPFI